MRSVPRPQPRHEPLSPPVSPASSRYERRASDRFVWLLPEPVLCVSRSCVVSARLTQPLRLPHATRFWSSPPTRPLLQAQADHHTPRSPPDPPAERPLKHLRLPEGVRWPGTVPTSYLRSDLEEASFMTPSIMETPKHTSTGGSVSPVHRQPASAGASRGTLAAPPPCSL